MQGFYVSAAVFSLLVLIPRGSTENPSTGTPKNGNDSLLVGRAPSTLQSWAKSEILFYDKLKTSEIIIPLDEPGDYIQDLITRYSKDFERSNLNLEGFPNGTLEERVRAVITNPVASVFMIRRVVNILSKLKTGLKKPDPNYELPLNWPTTEDLKDALLGLLRLCHMYNLDLKSLAAGDFQGIQTGVRLNSRDLYDIGTFDMNSTDYIATSIGFLELAYMRSKVDHEIEPSVVREALYERFILHDEKINKSEGEQFLGYSVSEALRDWGPFYYFLYQPGNEWMIDRIMNGEAVAGLEFRFQALCRHGSLLGPAKEKDLFCWYERDQNPYFAINPLKAELLFRSPDVVQFYNITGGKTTQRLKEMTMSGLKGSRVYRDDGRDTSARRTSVSALIIESKHDELISLPKTVELITGLKATEMTAAERLQVTAYTFSGYFGIHYDMLEGKNTSSPRRSHGSRLATFMYYLEAPKLGGYTAFPRLGIAVRPVEGSVVLWYNMLRNGGHDPDVMHGACPVILGEKWIATKWIVQYDQFLNRKCTLRKEDKERFQPFPIPGT